jgi:hypothetical protein
MFGMIFVMVIQAYSASQAVKTLPCIKYHTDPSDTESLCSIGEPSIHHHRYLVAPVSCPCKDVHAINIASKLKIQLAVA